jgi:hypothetical protein
MAMHNNKRQNSGPPMTPTTTKHSRLQIGANNIQDLLTKLSNAVPNNQLVQQLQEAVDTHFEDLKSLLADIETPEEKERKRSVVIIGLPEPQHAKASERVKADSDAISSMIDVLNVETAPVAVYRMGRPPTDNTKGPRLIKVVLPSSQHQWRVLGALKVHRQALRKLQGCGRVLIRPSLTQEERERERELQARLKKRRDENPGVYVGIRNGDIVVDAFTTIVLRKKRGRHLSPESPGSRGTS